MIVWAKKSFWIARDSKYVNVYPSVLYQEIPTDKPQYSFLYFEKECPYNATIIGDKFFLNDYLKQMVISNENLELLFYTNSEYIGKLRDKKIEEILN